jgi:hypothetical protein
VDLSPLTLNANQSRREQVHLPNPETFKLESDAENSNLVVVSAGCLAFERTDNGTALIVAQQDLDTPFSLV